MTTTYKRPIRPGEALAMDPKWILGGERQAQYWESYGMTRYNARIGTVAVVSINGGLDHHSGWWCESYDAIVERVRLAFEGKSDKPGWMMTEEERAARDVAPVPPSAVMLRIDSPGGVVSGLNESVFTLRRMSKEYGIPLVAYVDELAASAAFAIACACERIVLPPSAIAGSIGVLSTLYDQVVADEKMGIRVVTLTSGTRKADGHPHVAITDAAIAAEQRRVDKMAMQFYKLVSEARRLPVGTIQGFQAGIFLGSEAVKAGIADEVMGFDALLQSLNQSDSNQKGLADRSSSGSTSNVKAESAMGMLATIKNRVAKAKAVLEKTKDPKERAALQAAITADENLMAAFKMSADSYKKTKVKEYEETTEEAEVEESEEDAESDGGDEEASTSAESGDDDDDEDEDDDGEEASASAAIVRRVEAITGRKGKRAAAAFDAFVAEVAQVKGRLAVVEKKHAADTKSALIANALASRRITPNEAKQLAGKKSSYVKDYIGMRKGQVVFSEDDETIIRPAAASSDATEKLPAEVEQQITAAMNALGGLPAETRKTMEANLRETHLKEHRKRMLNGANAPEGA